LFWSFHNKVRCNKKRKEIVIFFSEKLTGRCDAEGKGKKLIWILCATFWRKTSIRKE
jgi:hypothetical protein